MSRFSGILKEMNMFRGSGGDCHRRSRRISPREDVSGLQAAKATASRGGLTSDVSSIAKPELPYSAFMFYI